MSSITLWAKRLFFVQNSFQAALNIPIVFKFGKQNSSNKIFLVKRWHFWTCFTWQMDMKVTEVSTISNLNFEERCFSTCFPSINDVWNSQYSTIKLNLTLKFWKSWIGRKNLDFFLCWQRRVVIRLKWDYPYIGIFNSESSKYFLAIVIWKLEKIKGRKNEESFLKCLDFLDEEVEL